MSEQTPLLERGPTAPPRQRYPHQTLRRVCTFLLVAALAVGLPLVTFFVIETPDKSSDFASTVFNWPGKHNYAGYEEDVQSKLSYPELAKIITQTPDEQQVREWSKYYTAGPHLMGQNKSQAEWTRDRWQEFGVKQSELVTYDVYTNYPKGKNRLALLGKTKRSDSGVIYEAKLQEDVLEDDRTTGLPNRVPTFHGYSAAGDVTGRFVYCNFGSFKDFEDLQRAGVELEGKIALVRYGNIFRGLKVKRAQELGMIGVVMYTDPSEDGVQSFDPEEQYPRGKARNPSSVQRGSSQFLSFGPGDPTTPGYPSKPGAPRADTDYAIPKIPSIPISYADAVPILKALNGHGPNATHLGQRWSTGALGPLGVDYSIGPSPPGLTLNLVNNVEYVTTPMWNVIGIINGTHSDEVVIMGNHRDAWIAGGAADPNSGSAAFNEVVRSFGRALDKGWKPQRTIVLASWDGEEYGLVGSTEWVEEYLPWLSKSAVAYLNVDVGTSGPDFTAAAAPLLDHVLVQTTHEIKSPNQSIPWQTVGDLWNRPIKTMGSGSDFTAFQDFAGVPCVDMGFGENPSSPGEAGRAVYHYHSNYDSFDWMDRFGDPGWHYHATIAKLWGLLAVKIAEMPVIPFNATNYAVALGRYTDAVDAMASSSDAKPATVPLKLTKLRQAISKFETAAQAFDADAAVLTNLLSQVDQEPSRRKYLLKEAGKVNTAYKYLERQFLHPEGLDGRSWFKHTVFAPGLWTGYAGATFPGLVESAEAGSAEDFYRWLKIVTSEVEDVVGLLGEGRPDFKED